MSEIRFDNRVVIITGAGGGLGKTYALDMARRGAKVVVNDLGGKTDGTGAGHSMADQTVKEIRDAGGTAVANYDSVATPEGGEGIVKAAVDNFGTVDAVINNAGILRDKTFAKLEPSDLNAVLDVHLKGGFYVSQPAFRVMKDKGYGRFVFASSGAGIFGNFGQTNYGAAKMGLVGLMHVLSVEGAKYNIKCNAIAPTAKTRMTEDLLGPMADLVLPETVTPIVTYLASEACEFTQPHLFLRRRPLRPHLRRRHAGLDGEEGHRGDGRGRAGPHRPDQRRQGLHHPRQHRRRAEADHGGAQGIVIE
jgi:NAD(P)-dependent dehydrogenase (short-subunit alcohol dehydrogenase family)